MIKYFFRDVVNGLFEVPTENARSIIPSELQPVELHHGSSILGVMIMDFTDSMVGPYRELILGIMVSPLVQAGAPMPQAAFYPFLLGTTTRAARDHAIEMWHLPHYMSDIAIDCTKRRGAIDVEVRDGRHPIVDLTVVDYDWSPKEFRYQAFMSDESGFYSSNITMAGEFSEHEEERGSLVLHPHPMTDALDRERVSPVPFREQWMREGVQTFQPLQKLAAFARR
ncbi:MAG TPA: acetoacetate decarboxylase family protein [Gemmatimonadaceae bacterium]|nr:acetoacetate decarboxylase family protein [Gemmatimonadaceae bacterium]